MIEARRLGTLTAILALTAASALGADYLSGVVSEYPGGSLWNKGSRVEISRETRLTTDAVIQADELVLSAPVVTQGNRLRIDVRKLIFKSGGKILAFDAPAAKNENTGNAGELGTAGSDYQSNQFKGKRRDGGPGSPGNPGKTGPEGYPGSSIAGEILISAGKIEGELWIDGTGQRGGQGGPGGRGGQGGRGGNGSQAEAHNLGSDDPAGRAGAGAPGGSGGLGGVGGQGGSAVQVTLLFGAAVTGTTFEHVTSKPGEQGDRGSFGDRGEPGASGNPGADEHSWGGFDHQEGGASPLAYSGPMPPDHIQALPNSLPAKIGAEAALGLLSARILCDRPDTRETCVKRAGVSIRSFNSLESARFESFKAWYAFHWNRSLDFLIRDSLRLASHLSVSRERLDALLTNGSDVDTAEVKALSELDLQYKSTVLNAWNHHFVEPLKDAPTETLVSGQREAALKAASQIIAVLNGSAALPTLKSLLYQVDQSLQQSLDRASVACTHYNSLKVSFLDEFSGATQRYLMPACEKTRQFLDRRHLADPIELTSLYETQLLPAGQFQLATEPASATSTAWRWLRSMAVPSAFADDFRILYVHDLGDAAGNVRSGEPKNSSSVDEQGVLRGYGIEPEGEVTLGRLPMMLRALAIELGARG